MRVPGLCHAKKLDDDEVAFAMGPSYMEDDIRLTTDKIGFCAHHMQMMYDFENRLGLGLILNTHMQNIIKNVETLQKRNGTAPNAYLRRIPVPLSPIISNRLQVPVLYVTV